MRTFCSALVLLIVVTGCHRPKPAAATDPLVVRIHSAGLNRAMSDSQGAKLRELLTLPETRALLEQTFDRLSRTPHSVLGNPVGEDVAGKAAPLLRPLIADVFREEAFLQVQRTDSAARDIVLAVAVPPDRMRLWQTNLQALAQVWGLGTVSRGEMDGLPAAELRAEGSNLRIRWVQHSGWLVLGLGDARLPGLARILHDAKTSGRLFPVLTDHLVEVSGNLAHWAPLLNLPPDRSWPRISLSVSRKADHLWTEGRFAFDRPVTTPLAPWNVPTNIIREPLIGFTAVRGIAPLTGQSEWLRELNVNPAPGEIFWWAQSDVTFQSFLAFPLPEATNAIERIAKAVAARYAAKAPGALPGTLLWDTNQHLAVWKDLLLVSPTLRPAVDSGRSYAVGGLFAAAAGKHPPPAELLAQLDRTNLLYYQWEVSEPRLNQWRVTSQLAGVILEAGQLRTNSAALPWLLAIEPRLGNTITEVFQQSDREWAVARRSNIGLTAFELMLLGRWLESREFPSLDWKIPETTGRNRVAPPTP